MIAWLLLLACMAAFLPELMASIAGGTVSAWFYAMSGLEAAALWATSAVLVSETKGPFSFGAKAICAWGAFEAIQRPMCRLMYPMDRPPPKPPDGKNLCDVVTGLPMSWVAVLAALFLAALVQEFSNVKRA